MDTKAITMNQDLVDFLTYEMVVREIKLPVYFQVKCLKNPASH